VYISNEHLQRGFSALADLTIGEYIRNRRLSLAGLELTHKDVKVIDVAMKYGYETSESFSKAFNRFHGFAPSVAKQNSISLKSYSRLIIKIIMEGGIIMDYRIEEREAFEVVAKIEGLTVEEIAEKILPSWSIEGEMSPLFKNLTHIIGNKSSENMSDVALEYTTKWYSQEAPDGELPDSYEVWQVPKYTWAVFKCIGAIPQAREEMWKRIYSEWLPQAKYEILPTVGSHIIPPKGDTSSPDYMSEIWLPVKKK
jgi:AraC family transcriptional regulator